VSNITTFSTQNITAKERPAVVSRVISSILTNVIITEPENRALEAEITSVSLKSTVLASFDLGPIMFYRSPELVKDGDDRFSLVTCVGGSYEIATLDGTITNVVSGMAGLVSHRLPSRTLATGKNQEKTLVFPRELISHALRNPDECIGAVPEGGMTAIRLMASYMTGLLNEVDSIPPKMQQLIEGHMLDLLANAYDPSGEWSRAAPNDGVNAARLQQVLKHVSESYADSTLSANSIAASHGVSPRIVHKLLSSTGLSLSQHLLEKRLQAARQELQNERLLTKRVSEIALDAGFSDVSYFNRCFRRRFGDTPTGFRPSTQKSAGKSKKCAPQSKIPVARSAQL
jgi:AraC-like DNA-binding protein